ncbi:MAG: amidohydrolase [Phycisphaerae bacterium]|nr:amidohydrolase [Phycisphaerae bacterium]
MSDLITRFQNRRPLGVPVFDAHAHMGRWIFPVFNDGSATAMLRTMDRLGVDAVALAHHAVMGPSPADGNRLAEAQIEPYPGRFYLYCGYSPHYLDEGPALLTRAFADPRYVGIKLHPSAHEVSVDDPRYRPAFEFANDHALPILIHTWVGGGCRPELVGNVAADFPDATVIMGHHGGGWAGFAESVTACGAHPNLVCDTCTSELTYKIVDRLTEAIGVRRVLFGSDIPFLEQDAQLGKVVYARISDDDKARVLGGNFLDLLKRRRNLPPVPLPPVAHQQYAS